MALVASSSKDASKQWVRKAKKELNENPAHVPAHIESFRRWVTTLPHITYPTKPELLLPFLRFAKYSHSKAQARLDNFCTLRRSSHHGSSPWFDYPDLNLPCLEYYLNNGILTELGRTADGIHFFLLRISKFDVTKITRNQVRMLLYMDLDRILIDPATQINGIGILVDLKGLTSQHLAFTHNRQHVKMEIKVWQDGYPLHVKHVILFNETPLVEMVFNAINIWFSKKMKQRFMRCGGNLEKAYDNIPGLKEIMPIEYNGTSRLVDSLAEEHAMRFRAFYSHPSPWSSIKVDETKRPTNAKNFIRNYKDLDVGNFGTIGTFVSVEAEE